MLWKNTLHSIHKESGYIVLCGGSNCNCNCNCHKMKAKIQQNKAFIQEQVCCSRRRIDKINIVVSINTELRKIHYNNNNITLRINNMNGKGFTKKN